MKALTTLAAIFALAVGPTGCGPPAWAQVHDHNHGCTTAVQVLEEAKETQVTVQYLTGDDFDKFYMELVRRVGSAPPSEEGVAPEGTIMGFFPLISMAKIVFIYKGCLGEVYDMPAQFLLETIERSVGHRVNI